MRIAIIGAAGTAGRQIARLLAAAADVHLVLCGRRIDRLQALGEELDTISKLRRPSRPGRPPVQTVELDVEAEPERLRTVSKDVQIVVGTTSRSNHGPVVARAAVECGASYLGLYLSSTTKWNALRKLEARCREAGTLIVDDGGAHPGLPAMLVRHVARFGPIRRARVAAKFAVRWSKLEVTDETVEDFLDEIRSMRYEVFENGRLRTGTRYARRFDFGPGIGVHLCVPMRLEELNRLPDSIPGLETLGFFVGGFGPVVDYAIFPLSAALAVLRRRWAVELLRCGLRASEQRDSYGVIVLDAEGVSREVVRYRLFHEDPYTLTAAPAVATLLQMADTSESGVWTQGEFVEPVRFLRDLKRLGVRIEMPE